MKTFNQKLIENLVNSENALNSAKNDLLVSWVAFHKDFNSFKKSESTQQNAIIKQVLKGTKITENTFKKRISMINSAIKKGLNPSKFKSFNALEIAKGNVTAGTHKVSKSGTAVSDAVSTAKIESDKKVVQAVNENELVMLLANSDFKKFKESFLKNDWKLATIMKALKSE